MTDTDDTDVVDDTEETEEPGDGLSFGPAAGPRAALRWRVLPALKGRVGRPLLRQLDRRLRRAARRIGIAGADLPGIGLTIVDDAEITRLNADHMGKDRPTDVLSFPARPPGPEGEALAAMGVPLGDIVLCWDAVLRQAGARVSPDADRTAAALDEATVLAIHGLCHLLGHDHALRDEGRAMHRRERRGLRAARVPDIARPYGLHPRRGT